MNSIIWMPVRPFRLKSTISSLSIPRKITTTSQNFQQGKISPRFNAMATPSKIHLTVKDTGIVHYKPQTEETAAKVSELLQDNHNVPTTATPPEFYAYT
jgi:hypothetical protein